MSNKKQASNKQVTCHCKQKVIRYWVAVAPDGTELEIRGVSEKKLKNGMKLTGEIIQQQVQDMYADGSYARSYTIEEWLQVKGK